MRATGNLVKTEVGEVYRVPTPNTAILSMHVSFCEGIPANFDTGRTPWRKPQEVGRLGRDFNRARTPRRMSREWTAKAYTSEKCWTGVVRIEKKDLLCVADSICP